MKGSKLFVSALAMVAALAAVPARAQQQVTPYGQQAVVMNAVTGPRVTPTGASAVTCHPPVTPGNVCEIQSLGQNTHYVTYSTTGIDTLDVRLEASFDSVNFFAISADAMGSNGLGGNSAAGAICAVGYFPFVRLNLVSFTGTGSFSALYSGTSAVSGCPKGTFNPAQDLTIVAFPFPSPDSSAVRTINAPYANSYGTLFIFTSSLHAGGTVAVDVLTPVTGIFGSTAIASQTLDASASKWWQIPLPPYPTNQLSIDFASGGSSSGGFEAFVIFSPPPEPSGTVGSHITTATNTLVKPSAGNLYSVTVNQVGSSGALATVYDGQNLGTCTGTVIATINVASQIGTFWYNQQFNQGLCVTTTGGTPADITVNYR